MQAKKTILWFAALAYRRSAAPAKAREWASGRDRAPKRMGGIPGSGHSGSLRRQ